MKVYILLILCVLFWSVNFIIGRSIHQDVDAIQLAMFRWGGASILVIPIFIKSFKKIISTVKLNFLILNILALLGIAGFNTILYIGLQDTTATNALLINSFVPILILILSFFILNIKIKKVQLLGIIISTIGVIFLVAKGKLSNIIQIQLNYGDIWVIISSITWALYSVLIKFKPKNLNDFEFFTTIVYIGTFWLYVLYVYTEHSLLNDVTIIKEYYWAFGYVAIFPSLLSYYFWHQGIHKIGANKTGQFTHLMPFFGSLLAYIFLGEKLYLYHIIGAICIAIGIYLSLFTKKETE